ncbi:1-acyl-sn-glycerol-3-phosphate acyltransferase [Aequorivita sp. SDUM287046]|uniref:1-acyl-sn-glycerol-3-phosphate acyltransferase n=1 Tax=Aequorivita aurantiaca TaxID=3053356 RepID=A0ABT8DFM0_9FLAO|nr:1-acyl-sn-glycerol-3-phosphate acyltransferase [Aequorivita aurantiaca]MDN3723612.1 1-acyl-sn-glycerol-3-phosphate acyltransferase [Aequorivita aurantiaca]
MGIIKFIFYNLMGWKIEGSFNPAIKKAVVIVVPHTSWHDFYIGAFARKILRTEINYIAKKELFLWPFGWYFKWMGGAPLDRTPGQNKVEAIAQLFDEKKEFRLALSPEGTRKKVESWKTGYYYIALLANVPIICVGFDYATKKVIVNKPFYPSGDYHKDSLVIRSYYKTIIGKNRKFS